jgi:hypothetical protein
MDTHPYTSHDIARLRCEERLLRAQEARRAREVPRAAKPEVARPVPRRLTLALAVRRLLTLSTVLGRSQALPFSSPPRRSRRPTTHARRGPRRRRRRLSPTTQRCRRYPPRNGHRYCRS